MQKFTGTARWADAATYSKKVMTLLSNFIQLRRMAGVLISNCSWVTMVQNGASVESLFSIIQDGKKTTSWGTTLFLMAGSNNGKGEYQR